jgi:hypothetical protein
MFTFQPLYTKQDGSHPNGVNDKLHEQKSAASLTELCHLSHSCKYWTEPLSTFVGPIMITI